MAQQGPNSTNVSLELFPTSSPSSSSTEHNNNSGPTPLQWQHVQPNDAGRPDGRWGHSTLLVADKYIVIVGGLQAGRTLNDAWVFNLENQKWARCLVVGTPPTPRWGHSSTLSAPHTLLLLGGREGSKPMSMSEYYELDLKTMTWTKKETVQPAPRSRYAHGVVSLGMTSRQLLLFGGHGGRSRYYNDVHILQLPIPNNSSSVTDTTTGNTTTTVSNNNNNNSSPPFHFSSSSHTNTAVTSGGTTSSALSTNSTYTSSNIPGNNTVLLHNNGNSLNDSSSSSSNLSMGVPQLSPLSNSLMQTIFNTNWLKSVGSTNNSSNNNVGSNIFLNNASHSMMNSEDSDRLSSSITIGNHNTMPGGGVTNHHDGIWLTPHITGTAPSKRSGHTATLCGNRLFIIGGYNGKDILNDLGILHLSTWSWSSPLVTGSGLPPLVGHCADSIPGSNQIVIFGGSVSATELSCSIYVLDTDILASTALHQARAPEARFWHRSVVISLPSSRPAPRSFNHITHDSNPSESASIPNAKPGTFSNNNNGNDTDANILSPVGYILSGVRSENNTDTSLHRSDATAESTFIAEANLSVVETYTSSDNSSLSGRNNPENDSNLHIHDKVPRTTSPDKMLTTSTSNKGSPNKPTNLSASNTNPRDYFIFVFGGSGERGQAYNDIHLLDVSALAHGEDLTETLALAPTSNSPSKLSFGATKQSTVSNGLNDDYHGTLLHSNRPLLQNPINSNAIDSVSSSIPNTMYTNGNPQEMMESGFITQDNVDNSIGSENNSGIVIGLVTRRATAPSMAVGLGGVGKMISTRNSNPGTNPFGNNNESSINGNSSSPTGSTISMNPSSLNQQQLSMYGSGGYNTIMMNHGGGNNNARMNLNTSENNNDNHNNRRFMNNNYPGMNNHAVSGDNEMYHHQPNHNHHHLYQQQLQVQQQQRINHNNNNNNRGYVNGTGNPNTSMNNYKNIPNNNNNRLSGNNNSNSNGGSPLPPPLPSHNSLMHPQARQMNNSGHSSVRLGQQQNTMLNNYNNNSGNGNSGFLSNFTSNINNNNNSYWGNYSNTSTNNNYNNSEGINNYGLPGNYLSSNSMGSHRLNMNSNSNNGMGVVQGQNNNLNNNNNILNKNSLSLVSQSHVPVNHAMGGNQGNNNNRGNPSTATNSRNNFIGPTSSVNMQNFNDQSLQQSRNPSSFTTDYLMNSINNSSSSSLLFNTTNNNNNNGLLSSSSNLLLDPLLSSNDPLTNQLLLDSLRSSNLNSNNNGSNNLLNSNISLQSQLLQNSLLFNDVNNLMNFGASNLSSSNVSFTTVPTQGRNSLSSNNNTNNSKNTIDEEHKLYEQLQSALSSGNPNLAASAAAAIASFRSRSQQPSQQSVESFLSYPNHNHTNYYANNSNPGDLFGNNNTGNIGGNSTTKHMNILSANGNSSQNNTSNNNNGRSNSNNGSNNNNDSLDNYFSNLNLQ